MEEDPMKTPVIGTLTLSILGLALLPGTTSAIPGSESPTLAVEVPADQTWVDTGLTVQPGQVVVISAHGAATGYLPGNLWHGPEGGGERIGNTEPCNVCSGGMLLGRIGSTMFRVGSFALIVPPEEASLELVYNDMATALHDNAGSFMAQIYILQEPVGASAAPQLVSLSDEGLNLRTFPNPGQSATTIEFDLPRETDVDVTIFDVTGRRVASLASGRRGAGFQRLDWDGTDTAGNRVVTGQYFVRLTTDEGTRTSKLTMLR